MKSLKQVKKQSTKNAVIKSLQDYIVSNKLQEGDSLPSEHLLAEQLGVSRNILREALQYFRTLGIIDSRPKTGAFIKQLIPENSFEGFFPYLASDIDIIREISDMRQVVELGAVSLIIKNISDNHIEQLQELLDCMKSEDISERKKADVQFHTTLLNTCKNRIMDSLKPLLVDYFEKSLVGKTTPEEIKRVYKNHKNIVTSLEKRNAVLLHKAIEKHYANLNKNLGI